MCQAFLIPLATYKSPRYLTIPLSHYVPHAGSISRGNKLRKGLGELEGGTGLKASVTQWLRLARGQLGGLAAVHFPLMQVRKFPIQQKPQGPIPSWSPK